ncbi:MAG: response regulator, partial [Treponema sp.]|nr:response regulator [Treponema sp.]
MEKRILFISSFAESFLITALAKTLENGGYEVVFSQPHPKEIAEMKNRPSISLLYLDNDATAYVSTLEYYAERLSHQTIDDPVYFFLIGNTVELDIAYRSLPKSLISAVFKRPVNTTDLITQLDLISTGYNYEAELPGVIKPNAGGPEDSSKKKILLVDDDSSLLRSMQTLLGNKYNVYITNSGMNTISFLKNHTVDLILLDYEMPILSGQEVFRILKSEQAT